MTFARPTKEQDRGKEKNEKGNKEKGNKEITQQKCQKSKIQIKWNRILSKTLSRKLIFSGKTRKKASTPNTFLAFKRILYFIEMSFIRNTIWPEQCVATAIWTKQYISQLFNQITFSKQHVTKDHLTIVPVEMKSFSSNAFLRRSRIKTKF